MVAVAVATMGLLAACSSDGTPGDVTRPDEPLVTRPDGTTPATEPAPEPTDAPAPAPTDAPAPEPTDAPEEPATSEPEGDDTTTEETIAIVLLIVLAGAIIGGLIVWLTRRSGGRDDTVRRQLASISTHTRWVIDQGIPALLATTDPAILHTAWNSVNTSLIDLQHELNAVAPGVGTEGAAALADLGTAVASTRASLDSGYQMRLQHPDDAELVGAADRSILAQRDQLERSIRSFEMATA